MLFLQKHFLEISGTIVGFIYSTLGMVNGSILTDSDWHVIKIALLSGIAGGIGGLIVKIAVHIIRRLIKAAKGDFFK